ncbi:MAG: PIN domain-containing protein [Anaerolineae bacterium]
MIYLLDTNAITDLSKRVTNVVAQRSRKFREGHSIALCPPIYYENLRGLLKANASAQIARLQGFKTTFDWQPLTDDDWLQAAQFWADADNRGKRLSDIDLLLSALARRLDAIIVSADKDFDALPVKREDWRLPSP